MNLSINRLLPVLFAGMFVYAGCAKQSVVKQDEPLVPAAVKTAASTSANQVVSVAGTEGNAATDIKSLPVASDEQKKPVSASETLKTAALQKAFAKIYFDFDSSTLSDTARQSLVKNSVVLKQNPQLKIRVEGNCDEKGSDEYNLALGERRAQVAVSYLQTMGVKADRLASISYGKEKPAAPGHDEADLAANRRDEFVIAR